MRGKDGDRGVWLVLVWWMGALLCLSDVALYSFSADGAVFGHIGICEARPCGIVTCFDGCQPGGFDWNACCGMEVVDKGSNAWEITSIEGSGGQR